MSILNLILFQMLSTFYSEKFDTFHICVIITRSEFIKYMITFMPDIVIPYICSLSSSFYITVGTEEGN